MLFCFQNINDDIKSLNLSIPKDMVKFDGEQDAKDCFPTMKMFLAFKTQRDAFYDLLENWKQNENQYELNPKKFENIKKMLNENNNSVNMSKFAKLFVAQLINSTFEESKVIYFTYSSILKFFHHNLIYSMFKFSTYIFRMSIKTKLLKSYLHQN